MTGSFEELMDQLCAPFPKEVHLPRHDGQGTYIPIHYYIERLNHVAGEHWSHERVGEPIFYMEDRFVHTVVKVTILGRSHMGEGFSKFQVNEKGLIINRHYAIRSATKDGIRDAISFFGIGKQQEQQTSTYHRVDEQSSDTDRSCMKCGKALTKEDIDVLKRYKIKFDYCSSDIPKHFLKNSLLG